ncbi:MAG: hypothetical protein QM770_12655 [Tepidisphaeraceae bacterium]
MRDFTTSIKKLLAAAPLFALTSSEDFFKSMRGQMSGNKDDAAATPADDTRIIALFVAILALSLCLVAIKHWTTRRASPKPANNQKKLLNEAAKRAGVSKRQMKQLEQLAKAEGLSSPLVAIICPSLLKKLAGRAESEKQRDAISSLARSMTRNA